MTVLSGARSANEAPGNAGGQKDDSVLKYNCDSCFRDISDVVHIQCAECEEVDLCVECFGDGTVLSTASHHLPSHPYRVIPPLSTICPHIATSTGTHSKGSERAWRADEEVVLVEALEANGMGNWQEVADQVTTRSALECYEHYVYAFLPSIFHSQIAEYKQQHPTPPSNGAPSHPAMHEISGFMPGRGEYETEWENEFELNYLKDFSMADAAPTLEGEERAVKLAVLKHYFSIISERKGRRSFALPFTRDFKKVQQSERARSRTEQKVLSSLRPFARFMLEDEWDGLVKGCVEEDELRRRIFQLQEYRRAGIRSLSQVATFENDQKHLDLYLKGGGSIMSLLSPTTPAPTHPSPISSSFSATRKASAPLNIANMEGYELLSEKERHLCSILRLYPRLYLSIKDTLIREYLKHGHLRRAQARAAVKIDVNKTSKLYDFFVSAGWVKPAADGD